MNKLKKKNPIYKYYYSREAPIQSLNEETRTVTGVLTTELPAIVMDWYNWRMIREILLIDGIEVPERIPLLDTHSRFTVSDIKGSVINARIEVDKVLGKIIVADFVFSSTAEKEFQLVKEGHLSATSIGYRVFKDESVEIKPGQKKEVNGKIYENNYPDELPLVIRLRSKVFEDSLVPIGADELAKFREMIDLDVEENEEDEGIRYKEIREEEIVNEGIRNKGISEGEVGGDENKTRDKPEEVETKNETKTNIKITLNKETKMDGITEELRVAAINKLAETFDGKVQGENLKETAQLYIHGGKSEREFADYIMERQKSTASFGKPVFGLTEKELKEYNIVNGLRAMYKGQNSFEKEVSDEYIKRSGAKIEGIAVPYDILLPKFFQRDLQATGTGSGAELVGTEHLGSMFIDYLYSKLVLDNITLLPNRQQDVRIPVLTGSAGYGWAASENATLAEGSPSTGVKVASPKRGGRFIDISKQLLIQSDPPAERVFINDLVQSIAVGIQNAVLNGSGASGQPTGLKNTSGLPTTIDLTTPSWAKFVQFETSVDDNFSDDRSMYFVTRRAHRGVLKSTPKVSGQPVFICENNQVNGYEMRTSNIVTAGDVFFGDWTQIIVPMWGALDVIIDPYTQATSGLVRVTADQLLDVIVRYPQAFAYGNNMPSS
jgi:HK97 family phage major capsid protein